MNLHSVLYKGQGRRLLAGGAVAALGLAIGAAPSMATPSSSDNVTFCHRTDASNNPYVVITTDPASILKEGHDGHVGLVWEAGIPKEPKWGDIIPGFDYPAFGNTPAGHFDGLNLSVSGLAFLNNDCQIPSSPSLTPVTPEATATLGSCTAAGHVDLVQTPGILWSGPTGSANDPTYTATAIAPDKLIGTGVFTFHGLSKIPSQSVNSAAACFVAKAIVKGVVKNAPVVAGEVENAPVVAGEVENAPVVAGVVENAPAVKSLAFTGAETVPLGLSGLLTLVLGAVLTVASRRQRPKQARE